MEITETTQQQPAEQPTGLLLLQDAQYVLHQSGKWANFLAIMGFIGSALFAIAGLFVGTVMSTLSALGGAAAAMPAGFGVLMSLFYILGAFIYFLISRHLYRYAGKIRTGIEMQSSEQVSAAFSSLHSFFKWKGIILIIILSLYVLMIIGVFVIGAAGLSAAGSGGQFGA